MRPATITTLGCASCGSTAPTLTSVMGRWTGTTIVGQEQWHFDMTLTDQSDSVRGHATLHSVRITVGLDQVVTGTVSGDSVRLWLRPIEDADIHIVAGVTPARLTGRMWLNNFSEDTHPIVFERQASP